MEQQATTIKTFIAPLILVLLAAPFMVWWQTTGNPFTYFATDIPKGQLLYVLSKLTGLYAILLLAVQIVVGFLKNKHSPRLHRVMGISVFLAMLLHGGLFVAAVSLRSGHIAWKLLLPNMLNDYYSFYLSLGVLALWSVFLVVYAGWRRTKGDESWRWIHRLSLLIFIFAFAHSASIGTEVQSGIYQIFYWFLAAAVLAAMLVRFWPLLNGRLNRDKDELGRV